MIAAPGGLRMQDVGQSTVHPRILLADDHAMVTESLRSLLAEKGHDVVGVVSDGRALIAVALELRPDVVILDIGMPLMNGLDAAAKLRQLLPKVKIVFLTMKDDRNLAAAVLSLGPFGYVLKHSAASELLTAIEEVVRGKPYVTPRLKPDDWAMREARAHQFAKDLTPRQREVLQLLAEGRPMKEVGGILNVSEKTVMFHKYHIMRSFNLKNNADLVLLALKEKLISDLTQL
jgi:DNA-binding NarL/FixJ family response regulator